MLWNLAELSRFLLAQFPFKYFKVSASLASESNEGLHTPAPASCTVSKKLRKQTNQRVITTTDEEDQYHTYCSVVLRAGRTRSWWPLLAHSFEVMKTSSRLFIRPSSKAFATVLPRGSSLPYKAAVSKCL